MRRVLVFALLHVACSSSESAPPADSGAVVDASAETPDTGRAVVSAYSATFAPSQLRASSGGLHFLAAGAGKDFGGAATTAGVALYHAALDGKTRWTFPTCLSPGAGAIDGLPSGEAVVVGSFAATCAIGGTTLTSAGEEDGFVARLEASGAPRFVQRFGGLGVDRAATVKLDPAGNAIIAGTSSGVDATSLQVGVDAGEFLAEITPAGAVAWLKQFNGVTYKIATGSKGEIAFFGSLLDGTDFGGGPIPRPTSEALAMVKMATDGSVQWSRVMTFTRIDGVTPIIPIAGDVAIDEESNTWFAVRFGGLRVDFGSGVVTAENPGALSILVGKLDPAGKPVFGSLFGGTAEVRLATGAGKGFLASKSDHAFVIAYGVDGTIAWRTEIGTASTPTGIGFDGSAVRAIGTFTAPIDFSTGTLAPPGAFLAAWAP